MSSRRLTGHLVAAIVAGGLPGAVWLLFGGSTAAGSLLISGVLVSTLATLSGTSPAAVLYIAFYMLVLRHLDWIRGVDEAHDRWSAALQKTKNEVASQHWNRVLRDWWSARDIPVRRGGLVAIGAGVGLVAGIAIAARDRAAWMDEGDAWLLPFGTENEWSWWAAAFFCFLAALWTAAATAVIAAPAYGRAVLFGGIYGALFGGVFDLASSDYRDAPPGTWAFLVASLTVFVAFLCGIVASVDAVTPVREPVDGDAAGFDGGHSADPPPS